MADGSGTSLSSERRAEADESWAVAVGKGLLLLALSILFFVFIPDRLLVWLSTRVTPRVRDTIVLLWVVVAFVVMAKVFVLVQRWRPS